MRESVLAVLFLAPVFAQSITTLQQKEEFLKTAEVIGEKPVSKGITNTVRVTLSNGTITHDASVQRIDEEKTRFEGQRGVELNFRDTYKFNIAAYRLARMIGLGDRIPPSIERKAEGGNPAAFTWWIENVQMDEVQRLAKKTAAPDKEKFNRQYILMQVFDNLIYNTDRNRQNIIWDKDWKLWMIDHTRAFRIRTDLLELKALKMCDRQLLANLKTLNFEQLKKELSPYLRETEIKALVARRDKIVAHFEAKGESALYDFLPKQ